MATQFGKYQLLKKIASGGMAEIHLAKQRGMEGFEKIVVIKMILPHLASNNDFVQMFLDEARLAAKLTHPNIVQIFDLGRAAGTFFIAMEYIQGENLRSIAKTCRKGKQVIPIEHTVKIISQSCEGLYHAHTKTDPMGQPLNVVHRDISPQNILVSFEGMTKVVDFGIAKAATQYQETRSGVLKGKYSYMSPEQCTGRAVDARSDLFSLGIVLWELATGTRLFKKASELMILKEITEGSVTPPRQVNQQIPAELEAIILKALEKDPVNRFKDALHMHLALEEFLKNQGMISSTVHLAAFMRELYKDKLDGLRKIEQAQASGESLESFLFDDVELAAGYDTGTGANTPSQPSQAGGSPVSTPSRPLYPKPTTGVSRVTGLTDGPAATAMATQASMLGTGPTEAPRRRGLLGGVLVVLLLVLGGVGYLVWLQIQAGQPIVEPGSADAGPVVAKAPGGSITVDSLPQEASAKIDGELRCTTPCKIDDLKVGVFYSLEVSKPGFHSWSTGFKLDEPDASEPRAFRATLTPVDSGGWGWVEVATDPAGAALSLDGQPVVGKTPITINQVSADKEHTLRAELSGRKEWVTTFKLRPNQRLRLTGKLPRAASTSPGKDRPAVYSLKSRPSGARFYLDGNPVQSSSIKLDPDRSYKLTAKLTGHQDWSETIEPSPGERKRIVARLQSRGSTPPPPDAKAKLFVDAVPWAEVWLDGHKVGTTPLSNYSIAAGSHSLVLKNPELNASQTLSIDAKPGEEIRRKVTFTIGKGSLQVRAKPWADVYLGNKKIGTTPLEPKELPEGTYRVRLHNPTLDREVTKEVVIKAGQVAKVEVDFLE